MTSQISRIIKNENFPLYLYAGAIIGCLLVLAINILRNLDLLLAGDPFYKPLDLFFVIYLLTIIAGGYTIYRLTKFYLDIRSVDYLLIAFFIFGSAVYLFMWQLWTDYLSPGGIWMGSPEAIFVWPELFVGRAAYFWGHFILLIMVIRLRPWKEYHPVVKGILFLLVLESFLLTMADLVHGLYWPRILQEGPSVYSEIPPLTFTVILAPLLEPFIPSSWLVGYGVFNIAFLSTIIAFLTLKPEINIRAVRISRISWIIFGGVKLLEPLYRLLITEPDYFVRFELIVIFAFFAILFLLSFLALAPEALLLTKWQLMRAKNLYAIYEREEQARSGVLGFLDHEKRLKDYLDYLAQAKALPKFKEVIGSTSDG
ncbi:MAG: hypothetical protein ACFFDT_02850 [Candidatus Hodarchaeota archaeon]